MGRKNSGYKKLDKKNVKTALVVLAAGMLFVIVLLIKNRGYDANSNVLSRDENGKNKNIKLVAETDFGEENIELNLLSRTLSEGEIERLKEDFLNKLKITILGQNESFEKITGDLNLAEELEGYPFEISYRIRPRGVFDLSGKLLEDTEEEQEIEIEITYSIEDFEEKELIEAALVPSHKSREEEFISKLERYLENENENNRNEKEVFLPARIDGVDISWSRKKNNKIPEIIVLTFFAMFAVLFKDRFLSGENEKKRREKIIEEYPEFVVKYALLNEAGLNHRQVVERLGLEFKKGKKDSPIYEEIYKVATNLKGGLPLTEALDAMARTCSVREITYFVSLINRNIKKGGKEIAEELRKTADESSNEKREKIRRKAETAGTKLLLPMVFLLIIVFALIMIPAFDSFSF